MSQLAPPRVPRPEVGLASPLRWWDWSVYGVADNAIGLSVLIGSVLVVAVAALVVGRSSRAVRTWEPLWQAAAAAFAGATLGLFFGALVLAIVYA